MFSIHSLKIDANYAVYGTTQFGAMVINVFQSLYPMTRFYDLSVDMGK